MMTTTIANEAPTATAPPPATPPVTQPVTSPVTPTGSGRDRPADTAGAGQLAVAYAPVCRCGREAHPDVDDPERHLSTHRTVAGHVVYYRCSCGRPRFAHLRWVEH